MKRQIRAIPSGGNNWQIFMDGVFVTWYECETDSSAEVIEDYCFDSGVINLDEFEVIEIDSAEK